MSTDHSLPAFSTALRGYDRDQVDRHVAQLTRELREAREGSAGATPADAAGASALTGLGSRIDAILAAARGYGVELVTYSEEEARSLMNTAHEEALDMVGRARVAAEELTRDATALADRRAEEIVANAEIEARGLLDASRAAARADGDAIAATRRREAERDQREQARGLVIDEAYRAAVDLARTLETLSGRASGDVPPPMARLPEVAVPPTGRARVTSVAFAPTGGSGKRPVPSVQQSGPDGAVGSNGSAGKS